MGSTVAQFDEQEEEAPKFSPPPPATKRPQRSKRGSDKRVRMSPQTDEWWVNHIKQWKESGLAKTPYARRAGLTPSSFYTRIAWAEGLNPSGMRNRPPISPELKRLLNGSMPAKRAPRAEVAYGLKEIKRAPPDDVSITLRGDQVVIAGLPREKVGLVLASITEALAQ